MSRQEFEKAKPRTSAQMARSSSVRAGQSSKSTGYDNPLYNSGDVLVERERDASEVMPSIGGDHSVARSSESPLVAKLKAQATERNSKLRQDRILNASVGVSPCFSSGNPFFPAGSGGRSSLTPSESQSKRSTLLKPPRGPSTTSPLQSPRGTTLDDSDSVDSLVLDDGPNPVRVVTPGATSTRAFAPASESTSETPEPCGEKSAAMSGGDEENKRPESAESEVPEGAIVPSGPMSTIGVGGEGNAAAGSSESARPCTPQRDRDLLKQLSQSLRTFVSLPGPLLDPLKCYIVREKAAGGLLSKAPHVYKLYREEGDTFLLAARRREHTKCPSYVISIDETVQSRKTGAYIGKTKSNFIGTEFQIFNSGERTLKQRTPSRILRQTSFLSGPRHTLGTGFPSGGGPSDDLSSGGPLFSSAQRDIMDGTTRAPQDSSDSQLRVTGGDDANEMFHSHAMDIDTNGGARAELGVVQYHMNVMGTKGPRRMVIGVPHVDLDTNRAVQWQDGEEMMPKLKRGGGSDGSMIRLVNKPPKWNSSLGAYCLNFNGRVTKASVKNFQLIAENDEQEREVLQFGRVAENRFTMDYAWPLSAYQAFCICITSLDSKLACE